MFSHFPCSVQTAIATTVVLAALMIAACSLVDSTSQAASGNPGVSYKYSDDDQLIAANQRALTYCNQFQSFPRPQSFDIDRDGSRTVVFECVTSSLAVAPHQTNSDLSYIYQTDQELVDAARNAQAYCVDQGSPELVSTIVTNSNGSKTVTFRCGTS